MIDLYESPARVDPQQWLKSWQQAHKAIRKASRQSLRTREKGESRTPLRGKR